MVTTDRAQGATHVEVADFDVQIPGLTNPNEPSREGSGKPHRKCYARSDFFEKGHVGTSRWGPRSIVVPANMGWGTQFILGGDRIFLSKVSRDLILTLAKFIADLRILVALRLVTTGRMLATSHCSWLSHNKAPGILLMEPTVVRNTMLCRYASCNLFYAFSFRASLLYVPPEN